ncbi:MAG: glycine--tRNA ligase subunit beta [Hyphomicrobium sp.]
MPEFLLELFSEEIPARLQGRASEDLKNLVGEKFTTAGLTFTHARVFSTPRRLTLVIDDLPNQSPTVVEEKKGPRLGAPDQAIQGFVKSAGLTSIKEAEIIKDEKKGDHYCVRVTRSGRSSQEIIGELIPSILAKFPWSKSMRWGNGSFHWIRPLQSMLCLLDGSPIHFQIDGIVSGDISFGHRFHAPSPFKVHSFDHYVAQLSQQKVILDAQTRAKKIREYAKDAAKSAKLELIEDEGLVAENAGLTEWPVVLMGSFDSSFLIIPPEVLMTTMKRNQKCFALMEPQSKKLANKFILVTNLEATDGGSSIISGNERVMRARLSDAMFFWHQDLKKPLDQMASELAKVTYHEKLGTQKDKVDRISELTFIIAGAVDANGEDARRAAQLAKADLVSEMVGEFPELQGLMGRYYAEKAGTKISIARAIELHYKPKGFNDDVPKEENGDSVAIAVALADKLDTLVGFWTIGEKPTGSGDPYQLRRAALGIIRIVLENDLRVALGKKINESMALYIDQFERYRSLAIKDTSSSNKPLHLRRTELSQIRQWLSTLHPNSKIPQDFIVPFNPLEVKKDLMAFFADRLKVYLKEKGLRHDLIDAIYALPDQDDLAIIVKRIAALDTFLQTEDGVNLLAGTKRASNILTIEEKKDKKEYRGEPNGSLLVEASERALVTSIDKAKFDIDAAINVENFQGAMNALAALRRPIDAFFEKVTVNVPNEELRVNRLKILSESRATTLKIADFTRIAG